ncbi:MAG: bacteriohemerythrin [Alphaproteobacteria bacterium]|nr:bacteriohemerythrin [Alphaproteobacteria bacterium]
MPLLHWKDEYEIGIRSVDHEHLALIGVINLLGDHLDPRCGAVEIRGTLGEICTLVATHFAHEESIMRDLGYDQYAEHKADHDRLLGEIREIQREIGAGSAVDFRSQLGERIGRWFGRHFETFDARLHALTDGPGLSMRE